MILIIIFFLKFSFDLAKRSNLNQSCTTGRYMQLCSWWLCHLKSFRTQNLCFKINDFDIHIFLNFSNDLGRRNDINQSCSTGRCMQLYSWWLCHLNSFRTQNLCFKINDFAICWVHKPGVPRRPASTPRLGPSRQHATHGPAQESKTTGQKGGPVTNQKVWLRRNNAFSSTTSAHLSDRSAHFGL